MDFPTESPDIVTIYLSDLRQIQPLTEAQHNWLGIAIDSERMLERLLKDKNPNNKEDCEFLYIGIFNKIGDTYDRIENSSVFMQKRTILSDIDLIEIISEIIKFKKTTVPEKQTKLISVISELPVQIHASIFDLIDYFLLLPTSLLAYYLTEIRRAHKIPSIANTLDMFDLLESGEEIKKIRALSRSAKEMLINSFLMYARYFAYKYRNRGLDYEDVIQEGSIGLLKAVNKYDIRRGVKFKTFAIWWIRQSILRAIANNSRTIRLPVHIHDSLAILEKAYRLYKNNHFGEPSISDLVRISGIRVEQVSRWIGYLKPITSLENLALCEASLMRNYLSCDSEPSVLLCPQCPFIQDESPNIEDPIEEEDEIFFCLMPKVKDKQDRAYNLLRSISSNTHEDELGNADIQMLRELLHAELENLTPRYRVLLEYRYGFKDGEGLTLEEVGLKFGVTRERIRQMEVVAKGILEKSASLRKYSKLLRSVK
jgi:RNA polymerase primary sigma factor